MSASSPALALATASVPRDFYVRITDRDSGRVSNIIDLSAGTLADAYRQAEDEASLQPLDRLLALYKFRGHREGDIGMDHSIWHGSLAGRRQLYTRDLAPVRWIGRSQS